MTKVGFQRLAAVKRRPVHHHSSNYISILSFHTNCGIFKNGVLFMYTLEGESTVAKSITAYEGSQ